MTENKENERYNIQHLIENLEKAELNDWLKHVEDESGSLFKAEEASEDKELIEKTKALLNGHFEQLGKGVTGDEDEEHKMKSNETLLSDILERISEKQYGAALLFDLIKAHVQNIYDPQLSMKDNIDVDDNKSSQVFRNESLDDKGHENKPRMPFNNRTLAYREVPLANHIARPKTYDELIGVLEEAIQRKMTIKAMGTQYAFNDITFTAGIQCDLYKYLFNPILTDKINEDKKLLNKYGLQLVNAGNMIISEAGTTTEMIHAKTWPIPKDSTIGRRTTRDENGNPYKMLPYMPGFHKLTIGGTIQVGAEGQGRLRAAVQNQVLSIHMLTISKDDSGNLFVERLQIEPESNAIHDKVKWDEFYGNMEAKKRVRLIQDDDVFNSVICCVGTMGIVYSYHLKLINAINLVQHRFLINWHNYKLYYPLIRKWEKMNIYDDNGNLRDGMLYNSNIYMSPYEGTFCSTGGDKWDDKKIPVILTMNITTNEDVTESPYEEINKIKNLYRGGAAYGDLKTPYLAGMAITWVSQSLVLNRFLGVFLYLALLQEKHEPLAMTALNSFLLGASSCVPVNVAGMIVKADTIIDAIEVWIEQFNQRDLVGNYKYCCTSPCGVTWCDKAYGYISMTGSEPRAWIEMPYCDFFYKIREIGSTKNMKNSMDTTYDLLQRAPYWGRFHLGLYNRFDKNIWQNKQLYPKFNTFLKYYKEFNHFGFFRNKFTVESDLDALAGFPEYGSHNDYIHAIGLSDNLNNNKGTRHVILFPNPPTPGSFGNTSIDITAFHAIFKGCVTSCCKDRSKCCYDFLMYFVNFIDIEEREAGWRFFLLGIICSSIGWFIGLSAIGTPLANAFYPTNSTTFYKKLCGCNPYDDIDSDVAIDSITGSDIFGYALNDMGYYIFAGIFLHCGSAIALKTQYVYLDMAHPWWWIASGAMWPIAVLLADIITIIIDVELIKEYLPFLFVTTIFRGLFLGIAQWLVLFFTLHVPNDIGSMDFDPKDRVNKWFHNTTFGLWWILQSIFAWGIQLPAGVNFFFFALAIPPYKLPPIIVILAIIAALGVLTGTVLAGAYGNTNFCGACE